MFGACTTCHTDPKRFHHGTTRAIPHVDCATCHDGGIASAKKGHAGLVCATCHGSMSQPPVPATCHGCHEEQKVGSATCTQCHSASGWIGKETVHATDPAATVACNTCHTPHNADLGACATCHGAHTETHHGTTTLSSTQLTLVAKPAAVKARRRVTLRGSLMAGTTALASESILVQARKASGGAFKKVTVATTSTGGRFRVVVKPRAGMVYRAVWRPTGAYVLSQRPALVMVNVRVRK
jgi:hypothetical protein